MSKHTPEPWQTAYRERRDGTFLHEVFDANGETIASVAWHRVVTPLGIGTDRVDNARRIVACVNACAGMEDPEAEIVNLKLQRAELLDALEELLEQDDAGMDEVWVRNNARSAIRKAKGGAA